MAVQTFIYGKPEVRYEGCVLDTYERNGYQDSYYYAVCWDDKKGLVTVEYDTTAAAGGGWAKIDATDETLHKVYRFWKKAKTEDFDNFINKNQAKKVAKGDEVVVVRGRKVKKGTVGKVFWHGTSRNMYSRMDEERVGIEVDGERIFLPASYVEKSGWEKNLITGKERRRAIRELTINAIPAHYRSLFSHWR